MWASNRAACTYPEQIEERGVLLRNTTLAGKNSKRKDLCVCEVCLLHFSQRGQQTQALDWWCLLYCSSLLLLRQAQRMLVLELCGLSDAFSHTHRFDGCHGWPGAWRTDH